MSAEHASVVALRPTPDSPSREGWTASVLEAVRRVPGLRVGITTKSPAVTRDLELLREIAASGELIVNVSIASTDAALLRRIEPRAPRPDLRLAAMAELTAAGVATRLFAMPVLPYLTDGEAELEALFHAAREAGAREAIWNVLFLRGETHGFFLEFIGREFPRLLARYRELYAGGASAESAYRARIGEMAERLALRAGFPGRSRDDRIAAERPARRQQLELTW